MYTFRYVYIYKQLSIIHISIYALYCSYLSEIIGKGGLNIRAIQDFTGVKLNVPQVTFAYIIDDDEV